MTAKCQSAARRSEDALFIGKNKLTDLLTEGAEDKYRYKRNKMRLYSKYAVPQKR